MWFAAMQNYNSNPWFIQLIGKLLQNDENALSLISHNPFASKPPKYIRALLYDYKFTTVSEWSKDWWKRRYIREYFPPVSLDDPALKQFMNKFKVSKRK